MNVEKRLLQIVRQYKLAFTLVIGLGFAAAIIIIWQAILLSQVIARVFLVRASLQQVIPILTILLGVILARATLIWASDGIASGTAQAVKIRLRRQLLTHLYSLGPGYTKQEHSGDLTNLALRGIETLDAYFSQYLPQLVLAVIVPLAILFYVFPLDLLSGFVFLLTAPLIPIFMFLIGSLAQAATRRQWLTLSRLNAYFLDILQGLTTLKALGQSRAQIKGVEQASDRFRQRTMEVLRVTFLSGMTLEMVATISTAVVAVEVGLRLLYGSLEFEQALLILLLAPEFYLPLRMLGMRFHARVSGSVAAQRIFEILDQVPNVYPCEVLPPIAAQHIPPPADRFPIRLEGVSFAYPGRQHALDSVTFQIEAGQKVALVGPSGAGKSTLVNLLLRFIEPQSGEIYAVQQPLGSIPADVWRSQIAWVPQTPYLFNESVLANIRLARPDAGMEEIIQAAQWSHAHEFIQKLPQGYNTVIGEGGARLSGGQAQRIALARAFLKNATLLIMDEAIGKLDPENESLVTDSLARLPVGRTVLIIAHRLNTACQAERIIVLEGGHLVEMGTHESLLASGGLYHRLVLAYTATSGSNQPSLVSRSMPESKSVPKSQPIPELVKSPGAVHALDPPRRNASSPLLRMLAFAVSIWRWIVLSVLLGVATIASGVGLMAASAYIISAAALHPSIALLQVPIVAVRFFGISRGIFRYLERMTSHQATFRLLARLRVWFYTSLEPLAPARLMRYRSGDLLARIMEDIESLENLYVRVISPPLIALVVALGVGIILARFDPRLAISWLFFLALAGIGVPLLVHWSSRDAARRLVNRRAELSACLVDSLQGMADLLVYNQDHHQLSLVDRLSQEMAAAQDHIGRMNSLQSALVGMFANLAMWSVLVQAIPLVYSGRLDGVLLASLALLALSSFEAVYPLPMAALYLESNLQSARRLFGLVDTQPEVTDPATPISMPARHPGVLLGKASSEHVSTGLATGRIQEVAPEIPLLEVRDLYFCYPTMSPDYPYAGQMEKDSRNQRTAALAEECPLVLGGVSFSLLPSKHLAIVGASGSGKSTLVSLILRFWEFRQGQILLGGEDLRCFRQEDVRRAIAVITQNTYLFHTTVRENLLVAQPLASEKQLVWAAKQARIHDYICTLPDGYDTRVGERGVSLSGGERQRLAIARALLKDASLLLLDEATANLDAITEQEVLTAIRDVMQVRSSLTLTHRLIGLEAMDEILVLHHGSVVERGDHAALLAQEGLYRRMWDIQNQVSLTDLANRCHPPRSL